MTWVLQAELSKVDGFASWYDRQQAAMRADELLRAFVEGRNVVVKQGGLLLRSSARFGMFRDRKMKLVLIGEISPAMPSAHVIHEHAPKLKLVHKDHVWIGEEYGIQRRWIAEELGQGEVVTLSDTAWRRVGEVVAGAHELVGRKGSPPPEHLHTSEMCDLLTESDLDPELPKKWGWVD